MSKRFGKSKTDKEKPHVYNILFNEENNRNEQFCFCFWVWDSIYVMCGGVCAFENIFVFYACVTM